MESLDNVVLFLTEYQASADEADTGQHPRQRRWRTVRREDPDHSGANPDQREDSLSRPGAAKIPFEPEHERESASNDEMDYFAGADRHFTAPRAMPSGALRQRNRRPERI
jgi:hypothetical protein